VLTVYLADDAVEVRTRLAALVKSVEGVTLVGQAENVPQAVAGIRNLRPDVAIVDIRMPGGKGMCVLEAAKRMVPAPTVIILTAFPTNQHRKAYLRAGADAFFDKATEFEQVVEMLVRLRNSQAAEETAASGSETIPRQGDNQAPPLCPPANESLPDTPAMGKNVRLCS
jgi:DNA-binding NarL/FixJ family response regulator